MVPWYVPKSIKLIKAVLAINFGFETMFARPLPNILKVVTMFCL